MKATFAAGCFWHVEEVFRTTPGVIDTKVGYTGGHVKDPTYDMVCADNTGHAEAVQVEYDPQKISFDKLLNIFWSNHNPTTPNRQGFDIGTQYRSAIFFHSPEQETLAKESKENLNNSSKFSEPIITEIKPASTFYTAEEYHQKYFTKQNLI
jgi:peptide-methionine (S)-S-oxide reductase